MPRAPSEKIHEAKKLFDKGVAMVEIAKKLDISAGTIRSWKNRYGWGESQKKKQAQRCEKNEKANATLQPKKRGAPYGNQNSKGVSKGKGNPNPKPPPVRIKHGGYVPVCKDALDEEERALYDSIPDDVDLLLVEQIRTFSIRERRLLLAMNKYREQKGDVIVSDVTRFEEKRSFKDKDEEEQYNRIQKEKVDSGTALPGKPYSIQTHTTNKDMAILRMEQELSTVQGKKTKAIEALSKSRLERQKLKNENKGNDVADDWIAAVMEGGDDDG